MYYVHVCGYMLMYVFVCGFIVHVIMHACVFAYICTCIHVCVLGLSSNTTKEERSQGIGNNKKVRGLPEEP